MAGFEHQALVESDPQACATLRLNRPAWNVVEADLRSFSGSGLSGVDLLAGGVPCPPFSVAGRQLGAEDARDLFPEALRLAAEIGPKAVMLENVRGILAPKFEAYRDSIRRELGRLGYGCFWKLLNARDFGLPQQRPRAVLVAVRREFACRFSWPEPAQAEPPTVGMALLPEMGSRGWRGAEAWARKACGVAPAIVGGSRRHGGPDLGPTRARAAWDMLGVDAGSLADFPPDRGFKGKPRLTVRMAALLQGFPPEWRFAGRKTPAYRQVGNAFPPPLSRAIGERIFAALSPAGAGKQAPPPAAVP
jgi:DNA (cytosine-5)-methyltransferase 1